MPLQIDVSSSNTPKGRHFERDQKRCAEERYVVYLSMTVIENNLCMEFQILSPNVKSFKSMGKMNSYGRQRAGPTI